MPKSPSSSAEQGRARIGAGGLWAAALVGPCAWFMDLVSRYFLVESGWAARHEALVITLGVGFATLAALAGLLSFRNFEQLSPERSGARLVAMLGSGMGTFSSLVILATLIPHGFLHPVFHRG
jgi:hypothetical protein